MTHLDKDSITNLLNWCIEQTKDYPDVEVKDFSYSWSDGLAFAALIHRFKPEIIDFQSLSMDTARSNLKLVFSIAEKELSIQSLLKIDNMIAMTGPDKLTLITYLSQFYNCFKDTKAIGSPKTSKFTKKKSEKHNSRRNSHRSNCSTRSDTPGSTASSPDNADLCSLCGQKVFLLEQHSVNDRLCHRSCYRSSQLRQLDDKIKTLDRTIITQQQEAEEASKTNASSPTSSPHSRPLSPPKYRHTTNTESRSLSSSPPSRPPPPSKWHRGDTSEDFSSCASPTTSPSKSVTPDLDSSNPFAMEEDPQPGKQTQTLVKCEVEAPGTSNGVTTPDSAEDASRDPPVKVGLDSGEDARDYNHGDQLSTARSGDSLSSELNQSRSPEAQSSRRSRSALLSGRLRSAPSPSPSFSRNKRPAPLPPAQGKKTLQPPSLAADSAVEEPFYPVELNPFGAEEVVTEIHESQKPQNNSAAARDADIDFEYKGFNPFDMPDDEEQVEEQSPAKSSTHISRSQSQPSPRKRHAPAPPPPAPSGQATTISEENQKDTYTNQIVRSATTTEAVPQRPTQLATSTSASVPVSPALSPSSDQPMSKSSSRSSGSLRRSLAATISRRVSSFRSKRPAPSRPPPIKRMVQADAGAIRVEYETARSQLEKLHEDQTAIEVKARSVQDSLWKADESTGEFETILLEWLSLVAEKDVLLRQENEVLAKLKQQELEDKHSELEYELRILMGKQEAQKTDSDRQREEELISMLVKTVDARAELVEDEDLNMDRPKPEHHKHDLEKKFKRMLCIGTKFHKKKDSNKKKKKKQKLTSDDVN